MKDKNIKDPAITHLIHSNFCSGDFHSMEVLKLYFNIKLIPFRMPYKITTASFNLMQKGIRDIISVFSTISGKEYEPRLLWNAIDEYNTMQELYREIATIPVTGMERLMKFMEIELAPWQEKKRLLEATVESFQEGTRDSRMSHPDIILTGSPIFHGDRFMHLLERLEIPIRFFDFHFADGRTLTRIPVTRGEIHQLIECDISDPVQVLAAFYLEDLCPERMVQSRKNHLEARIERLMQYQSFLSPGKRIHGVISHVLKFCDVYGTHRSKLKEIMQEMHGIPVLDLERDFSTGSTGQIRTRIEAFMELITNSRKER
ncbi:hypothetical protein GF325_00680 [Candidatus Bathyarchaeota archaeon]|nr:hypothetical protein [Candidatus Bathyarchaeota archaeon]